MWGVHRVSVLHGGTQLAIERFEYELQSPEGPTSEVWPYWLHRKRGAEVVLSAYDRFVGGGLPAVRVAISANSAVKDRFVDGGSLTVNIPAIEARPQEDTFRVQQHPALLQPMPVALEVHVVSADDKPFLGNATVTLVAGGGNDRTLVLERRGTSHVFQTVLEGSDEPAKLLGAEFRRCRINVTVAANTEPRDLTLDFSERIVRVRIIAPAVL